MPKKSKHKNFLGKLAEQSSVPKTQSQQSQFYTDDDAARKLLATLLTQGKKESMTLSCRVVNAQIGKAETHNVPLSLTGISSELQAFKALEKQLLTHLRNPETKWSEIPMLTVSGGMKAPIVFFAILFIFKNTEHLNTPSLADLVSKAIKNSPPKALEQTTENDVLKPGNNAFKELVESFAYCPHHQVAQRLATSTLQVISPDAWKEQVKTSDADQQSRVSFLYMLRQLLYALSDSPQNPNLQQLVDITIAEKNVAVWSHIITRYKDSPEILIQLLLRTFQSYPQNKALQKSLIRLLESIPNNVYDAQSASDPGLAFTSVILITQFTTPCKQHENQKETVLQTIARYYQDNPGDLEIYTLIQLLINKGAHQTTWEISPRKTNATKTKDSDELAPDFSAFLIAVLNTKIKQSQIKPSRKKSTLISRDAIPFALLCQAMHEGYISLTDEIFKLASKRINLALLDKIAPFSTPQEPHSMLWFLIEIFEQALRQPNIAPDTIDLTLFERYFQQQQDHEWEPPIVNESESDMLKKFMELLTPYCETIKFYALKNLIIGKSRSTDKKNATPTHAARGDAKPTEPPASSKAVASKSKAESPPSLEETLKTIAASPTKSDALIQSVQKCITSKELKEFPGKQMLLMFDLFKALYDYKYNNNKNDKFVELLMQITENLPSDFWKTRWGKGNDDFPLAFVSRVLCIHPTHPVFLKLLNCATCNADGTAWRQTFRNNTNTSRSPFSLLIDELCWSWEATHSTLLKPVTTIFTQKFSSANWPRGLTWHLPVLGLADENEDEEISVEIDSPLRQLAILFTDHYCDAILDALIFAKDNAPKKAWTATGIKEYRHTHALNLLQAKFDTNCMRDKMLANNKKCKKLKELAEFVKNMLQQLQPSVSQFPQTMFAKAQPTLNQPSSKKGAQPPQALTC